MNPIFPIPLSDRFVMILEGIHAATAARFRSAGWTVAMVWAVCGRIRRIERRVMGLLALFRAGRLPAEVVRRPRSQAGERREAAAVKLPRGFGWLLPMVPCAAAGFAGQLRLVLAEPEMAALLAASPKARRAMLTLGRMLAIGPEVIAPKGAHEAPDAELPLEDKALAETAVRADDPGGFVPGRAPPAPDFRFFRDGTPPQGPPLTERE